MDVAHPLVTLSRQVASDLKRVPGVLCDRNKESEDQGEGVHGSGKTGSGLRGRDIGI